MLDPQKWQSERKKCKKIHSSWRAKEALRQKASVYNHNLKDMSANREDAQIDVCIYENL